MIIFIFKLEAKKIVICETRDFFGVAHQLRNIFSVVTEKLLQASVGEGTFSIKLGRNFTFIPPSM